MSPSEYQELVEFLTGQFAQVDQRLDQMDQRFGAVHRYMDGRFLEIERRLDA